MKQAAETSFFFLPQELRKSRLSPGSLLRLRSPLLTLPGPVALNSIYTRKIPEPAAVPPAQASLSNPSLLSLPAFFHLHVDVQQTAQDQCSQSQAPIFPASAPPAVSLLRGRNPHPSDGSGPNPSCHPWLSHPLRLIHEKILVALKSIHLSHHSQGGSCIRVPSFSVSSTSSCHWFHQFYPSTPRPK